MMKEKNDPGIRYQTHPQGKQRCELCSMYRTPNECTLVKGYILPRGWCKRFAWKELEA